jgi:hypothetical protein
VAAEKGCAAHDVPITTAVGTLFLLLRIETVIDAVVTRLLLHRIHPSTPLAVPALLLLLLFGHLYGEGGSVKMDRFKEFGSNINNKTCLSTPALRQARRSLGKRII